MDNQPDSGRADEGSLHGNVGDVTGESVSITRGGADSVRGTRVTLRQAGGPVGDRR
jgi:hypothetical protein